jgi:hypothetical protein
MNVVIYITEAVSCFFEAEAVSFSYCLRLQEGVATIFALRIYGSLEIKWQN